MFCPKCGTNGGDAAFCSNCGTSLAAPASAAPVTPAAPATPDTAAAPAAPSAEAAAGFAQPMPPVAPKKPVNKTLFIAIGGGVTAVILAVVAVLVLMPYSLSPDRAKEILVQKSSFSSDMKDADEPNHIGDMDYPVFGTGADDGCTEEADVASAFDQGTMLAFSDYSHSGTGFGVWEQSFWEFESADTPKAIIEATRSGYANSDCQYFSSTSTSIMSSTVSDLGDSGSTFGVESENSVFFVDKTSYISSLLTLNWTEGQMFVQKGRFLMSIRFTADTDEDLIYSDFENAATLALESFH